MMSDYFTVEDDGTKPIEQYITTVNESMDGSGVNVQVYSYVNDVTRQVTRNHGLENEYKEPVQRSIAYRSLLTVPREALDKVIDALQKLTT